MYDVCIIMYALCKHGLNVQLALDSQRWLALVHLVGSTHGEALNDGDSYFSFTQEIDRSIDCMHDLHVTICCKTRCF